MPDLTPIHPDLRALWKKFPKFPFNRFTRPLIHGLFALAPQPELADNIQFSELYAESLEGKPPVRLLVLKPSAADAPLPVLLHMHGGGLVIGKPEQDLSYLAKFVEALGIVVISVDYRLAPRHPFPAAVEDCYTALTWVHHHAEQLGIDPDRIAVGGKSAGGHLAASLSQMAYDRGEVSIRFQLLIYPMLDDRSALLDDLPHTELMIWKPRDNRFGWQSYLGQPAGADNVPPYAVPARREDLTGLPPAWIGVGSLDLFYQENIDYAERLKQCGVDCELVVIEQAFHGFDTFDDPVNPIEDFRGSQIAALRAALLNG